ncbi:methylmalonyl-CoA mutase [bacterium]|nr:methylmalonyl-CoA mutase [bacterium]|tara:strand:+ start:15798 stop:17297 length:1500 start_codon:yes stop_codon:yes gene_type:complete
MCENMSDPGSPPFVRGIYKDMYKKKPWTMRQYSGFSTAEQTNKRFKNLLKNGQTGLSVAFDLPTQMGLDSDNALSIGEVGRAGVAIDTIEDMRILLDGIPLDKVSISMTINSPASIIWAMLLVVAEEQNVSWKNIRGTIQNDILKEYVARGTYIFPPEPSMKLTKDTFEMVENVPNFNPISISGYHIREAGASAALELGITFSHAIAYLDVAKNTNLDFEKVVKRFSFFFGCHNDIFEEVAKFRAARWIWNDILEDYGVNDLNARKLRFHTQTCGSTLTRNQPLLNVARVALQALAATLGGTQSLHTNAYDEAIGLPTEESALIALRTQQILYHESGLSREVDPFGGSQFIENETCRIRKETNQIIDLIKKSGGAIKSVENGLTSSLIHEESHKYQKEIENKERLIIGVNSFEENSSEIPDPQLIPEKTRENQIKKLNHIKNSRDDNLAKEALQALSKSQKRNDNLMPCILSAVKKKCTIGEICAELGRFWGTHSQISS